MASLATNEVRQLFRNEDWPVGLKPELREPGDFLRVLLYRERINALTGEDKMRTYGALNRFMNKVHNSGIPIEVRVVEGDGNA